MRSWANNPRYQRAMKKIAALQPHHRAILQTVTADKNFADEAMRKSIQSMITSTGNISRERNLGLRKSNQATREKITAARNAMARRDLDYNKGQGKKAFAIGLGNLGLSGLGSWKQRQRDKDYMDIIRKMAVNYDPVVGLGSNSRWTPRQERGW